MFSCEISISQRTLFTDTCQEQGARSREEIEEGDRKEPLRFDTLEVTSLEQSVPEHVVKTYDEVTERGQAPLSLSMAGINYRSGFQLSIESN